MFRFLQESEVSLVKNVGRWLLVLLAAGLLLILADKPVVLAQSDNETIGFKNVQLWLYPEYDDPRLLVMLEGQIDGAEAPVKLRFLVPSAAEMYAAGSMNSESGYSGGPPDRESSSIPGWDEISYEVTTDTFRVEYYDPIIRGAPDKSIDYQFRSLYPISSLSVVVQEPLKSTNFSVVPVGSTFTDNLGLISHGYPYTDFGVGETREFNIVYTKSDPGTSVSAAPGQLAPAASTSTLVAVLVAIAVSAAFVGGFLLLMRAKGQEKTKERPSAGNKRARSSGSKSGAGQFCTNCGQGLEKSANFCPNCGTKVP